jgi:hypothetical protein
LLCWLLRSVGIDPKAVGAEASEALAKAIFSEEDVALVSDKIQ